MQCDDAGGSTAEVPEPPVATEQPPRVDGGGEEAHGWMNQDATLTELETLDVKALRWTLEQDPQSGAHYYYCIDDGSTAWELPHGATIVDKEELEAEYAQHDIGDWQLSETDHWCPNCQQFM